MKDHYNWGSILIDTAPFLLLREDNMRTTVDISTDVLNSAIIKLDRCYKENLIVPLTSVIEINISGDLLSLRVDSISNSLLVYNNINNPDNISIYGLINYNKFTRVVKNTTVDTIKLGIKDGYITFKGNGLNKFPLLLDHDRKPFVNKQFNLDYDDQFNIAVNKAKLVASMAKGFLADVSINEAYNYFYCADDTIAGDGTKFIIMKQSPIRSEKPILIHLDAINLLSILDGEYLLNISYENGYYYIMAEGMTLYFKSIGDIDYYSEDLIYDLNNDTYYPFAFTKYDEYSKLLGRLSPFISKNSTDVGILFKDKSTIEFNVGNQEAVEFIQSGSFDVPDNLIGKSIIVDYDYLTLIKGEDKDDNISMHYDGDRCVKFKTNIADYLIARKKM